MIGQGLHQQHGVGVKRIDFIIGYKSRSGYDWETNQKCKLKAQSPSNLWGALWRICPLDMPSCSTRSSQNAEEIEPPSNKRAMVPEPFRSQSPTPQHIEVPLTQWQVPGSWPYGEHLSLYAILFLPLKMCSQVTWFLSAFLL